jgi:hypothetical protein
MFLGAFDGSSCLRPITRFRAMQRTTFRSRKPLPLNKKTKS